MTFNNNVGTIIIIDLESIVFTLKCFDGNKHKGDYLIEIDRFGNSDEAAVVNWCQVCGAVAVDLEVDGRLMGKIYHMAFPAIVQLRDNKE